jgi:thiol-disulfide isomerase/thioredoxin
MKNLTYKLIIKSVLIGLPVFFSAHAFSQKKDYAIRNLKIGDTIPDIAVSGIINASNKTVQISDLYKHGLLIIDFWATWCIPCISELPVLDSLQMKFSQSLNVLAVAYQDSSVVNGFLRKNPSIAVRHLTISTNDKTLVSYFRHTEVPHNVWIDKKGIVRAITNKEEVNQENVAAFLSNKALNLPVKSDNLNFDANQPFHLGDTVYKYRSIWTPHINGIPSGDNVWGTHEGGINRFFGFNDSILNLFWVIYSRGAVYYNIDDRLLKVITNDSIKFYRPAQLKNKAIASKYKRNIDWEKDNVYCYDLTIPKKVPDTIFYQYMLNDFQRIFNVSCTIERQPMRCNVVRSIPGSTYNLSSYRSTSDSMSYAGFFKNRLTIKNSTIKNMIHMVLSTWKDGDDLWIDETGINFPINLVITFDRDKPITMETIKSKLEEYGLIVEQKVRPYPVMILKDNNL